MSGSTFSMERVRANRFQVSVGLTILAIGMLMAAFGCDHQYFIPAIMFVAASIISWMAYSWACRKDF